MDVENKQEQVLTGSRFKDLIESTDHLQLDRVLDMDVDLAYGDTILTPAKIEQYDDEAISNAIERWSSYAVSLDENDVAYESRLALAHSKVNNLNLARLFYGQVLGDEDHSEEIRQLEMQMFNYYTPSLYHAALKQKVQSLEALVIDDPALRTARADIIDTLESFVGNFEGDAETLEKPEAMTLVAVGDWLKKEFGAGLEAVDGFENDTLDASQLVAVFNHAIRQSPALHDAGWVAKLIERKKNAVSVIAARKEVVVPSQREAKKDLAKRLVIHEVYGHALKSANAEILGNEIGTIGTASYPTFEESFELALEQCLMGTYDPERGLDHYIATGLVVTDNQPAREIAHIFESIKQIEKSVDGMTPDKLSLANRLTQGQLRRTFAGMTDVDDGIAHLKDINYLHGLNGTWKILNKLVQSGQLEEGMKWLLSAKFNPFDKIDRELVNSYVPMPSCLYELFESGEGKAA